MHTVKIFKKYEDISELYSKKFKYILVDEYQDTNFIQSEWLKYLKMPKHGIFNPKFNPIKDMELNDTGLAPYLSKLGNKKVTKEQLVKDFDNKLAPELDVVALGGDRVQADKIYRDVMKYDLQEYRPGPVKNVLQSIRNTAVPLKNAIQNNNQEAVSKIIDAIEKYKQVHNSMIV